MINPHPKRYGTGAAFIPECMAPVRLYNEINPENSSRPYRSIPSRTSKPLRLRLFEPLGATITQRPADTNTILSP